LIDVRGGFFLGESVTQHPAFAVEQLKNRSNHPGLPVFHAETLDDVVSTSEEV
jgi:hypothetical protein